VDAFIEFVLAHLPPPPARVLDVGCGDGGLTRALAAHGYDVTGIDPIAPDGDLFRPVKLEDVDEEERFDGVVASHSFHHMPNLEPNLDRVAALLAGGGPFVLDELAWDRLDEATADWYDGQRRILEASLGDRPGGDEWDEYHAGRFGVHRYETLRSAIDARFEGEFELVPHLWRHLGGPATLELEEALISSGAIQACGFRFAGAPRGG
jgi:SAM-dependent methyltransferase